VFEDGQWMDSASWRLLEMVLSIIPRVLIVVCVRAGEAPDELVSLRRRAEARIEVGTREGDDPHQAHWIRTIDLEDLDDLSIANLLLRTLDGQPPDEDLARKIAQLARGNPFFAEEIALTLKSEGLIAIRD